MENEHSDISGKLVCYFADASIHSEISGPLCLNYGLLAELANNRLILNEDKISLFLIMIS